ncbi:hypothetical protein KP509_24G073900 [Ceratopteris richardii]|uniref:Uncharacterized protein n=1 Tax=Ceratopteris richardii TaxID=49495 RepID=A0A8T2RYA0_CERRI|nr:hypothetical protein KP509_24G073900 [Ceratopteris richardii]
MGISNVLIVVLNTLTFILSIPIIAVGAKHDGTDCYKFLQKPVIALGVFIMLMSIMGIVGAACKNRCMLWIYLLIMFVLILLLFVFTIFAFVVTNKTAGDIVGGKGYKEYHLGDYSTWLRRQLNKASNWDKIQKCIDETKFCPNLAQDYPLSAYPTSSDFQNADISPIQSGCCIPPSACGCSYVNATYWSPCSNTTAGTDCGTYSTDPSKLCYGCDSCKAGVLQTVTKEWRKIAIANIIVLVFLIIVYSVGCCAFKSAKMDKYGNKPYV